MERHLKVDRHEGDTGGNFSVNYLVVNDDGREGFCKVMNYSWVLQVQAMGLDPRRDGERDRCVQI